MQPHGAASPLRLRQHPTSRAPGDWSVTVAVLADRQTLDLDFRLSPTTTPLWPEAAAAVHTDGLWRTTCFELFVRDSEGTGYREWNFSPSGAFAAYAFDAPRTAMRPVDAGIAMMDTRPDGLRVRLRHAEGTAPHRAALAAVLDHPTAGPTYWALHHPRDVPDFHDQAGFVLELP